MLPEIQYAKQTRSTHGADEAFTTAAGPTSQEVMTFFCFLAASQPNSTFDMAGETIRQRQRLLVS